MTRNTPYGVLTLAVLALVVGPIGTAVFVLGFVYGDSPCVLCWAQRTGMVLIALVGLFVLRYGPRPRYVGLGVLIGAWGVFMGLRHSSLHLGRDVGQGFSVEIFGAHTYTWSMFIYWVCIVAMGVLLLMLRDGEATATPRQLRPIERLTMWLFLVAAAGNAVQAFASTGPPPYMGQGDPIRFSFTPANWVWSLEEWSPAPVSLRGRWGIAKPDIAGLESDPERGPLGTLPVLSEKRRIHLSMPFDGPVTDLAYDRTDDRFLITTEKGIYIADGTLSRVLRRTIVDTGFSVDLARFGGATFVERGTVMALSENKSYVILRESDRADAAKNFRFFLESFDEFDEVARSRLTTVRARMMYVLSVAFDPESGSFYTVTVPNAKVKRLVVSRFDRRDMTLSEEFTPALDSSTGLALAAGERSINEYYVAGAACEGGHLYALSAAFNTLVVIDPGGHRIAGAYAVPGLARPVGLAFKGTEAYILGEDRTVTVVEAPGLPLSRE
ncbi:MAG: disulfide bond formation protein B [Acidobacteriota bacterium]